MEVPGQVNTVQTHSTLRNALIRMYANKKAFSCERMQKAENKQGRNEGSVNYLFPTHTARKKSVPL